MGVSNSVKVNPSAGRRELKKNIKILSVNTHFCFICMVCGTIGFLEFVALVYGFLTRGKSISPVIYLLNILKENKRV